MQLVINIDDELYEIIKNPKKLETMYHAGRLCEAVRKGIPLPKGHGRIGDLDALANEIPIDVCDGFEVTDIIEAASPIIEADKEQE